MTKKFIAVMFTVMSCSICVLAQEVSLNPESRSTSQGLNKRTLWSANESIGANIVSANGEDLGDVEDIILDRNKNRIAYVIVSYGGILGLGDKHFAVPWQAFRQTDDRELSLDIDQEELKNAPGFEKGTLPNTADPVFHEGIYLFYKTSPYSLDQQEKAGAKESATQDGADESMFDWDSWTNRGDDTTWARRLSELIGTNIENAQGETIAELEDIIVDSREARAGFAVVSYGGTLGYFADTAIIPWNALRLDLSREVYVTDATIGQLEQAKLSDTEYRNLEDRKYSETLFGTFRTEPFWDEFGYESEMDESARAAEAESKADAKAADVKADHASAQSDSPADEQLGNTVIGTVVSVSSYPGMTQENPSERGIRIRVRAENGSVRTAHVRTNKEMERQELTFKRGDKVVINGELRNYRSHKVLFAREVQKDGKTVKFEK